MSKHVQKLAATLQNFQGLKYDNVLPSLALSSVNGNLTFNTENGTASLKPNKVAVGHIARHTSIPTDYLRRCRSNYIELYDKSVNTWLHDREAKDVLVRGYLGTDSDEIYHNTARAILSGKYGFLDNYDVFFAVLQQIQKLKAKGIDLEVIKSEVSEKRLYMRIVAPGIKKESRELLERYRRPDGKEVHGDDNYGVGIGMLISNSEVGAGSFSCEPLAVISKCTNRVMFTEDKLRKYHMGKALEYGEIDWSEMTRNKAFELAIEQMQDAMNHWLTSDFLSKKVSFLESIGKQEIKNPSETIAKTLKEHRHFSKEDQDNILNAFIRGGDTRAIGVGQALTWESQQLKDPDKAYDWEKSFVSVVKRAGEIDRNLQSTLN